MTIRLATEKDLGGITEIYNQAIALGNATADMTPVTQAERSAWLAQHDADHYPVYVAVANNEVVGYCSLSAYRPGREALQQTAEISYYIHQHSRRQGVGSALLTHAIAQCPALGLQNLLAILLDTNAGSIRILEKFGFEQWGHMPGIANFSGAECGHLYFGRRI